jgi:Fe-S cluster assembly protein SufB
MVRINPGAKNSKARSVCDTFLINKNSIGKTFPHFEILEKDASVAHEASVSTLDEEKLNYLKSKGVDEKEALELIVHGFAIDILEKIPLEYSVEIRKILSIELGKKVG